MLERLGLWFWLIAGSIGSARVNIKREETRGRQKASSLFIPWVKDLYRLNLVIELSHCTYKQGDVSGWLAPAWFSCGALFR